MSQENTPVRSATIGVGAYSANSAAGPTFSTVDQWPAGTGAAQALAEGDPTARIAVYLCSIRKMMVFFTVVTVLALIAAVILGIVDIAAIHSLRQQQTTVPFG